jgi:hypothetical protein
MLLIRVMNLLEDKECIMEEDQDKKHNQPAICESLLSIQVTKEVLPIVLQVYWPDKHQDQELILLEGVEVIQDKLNLKKLNKMMDTYLTEVQVIKVTQQIIIKILTELLLPKNHLPQDNLVY